MLLRYLNKCNILKKRKEQIYVVNPIGFKKQMDTFSKKKIIFIHIPKAAGTSIFKSIYNENTEGHFPAWMIKEEVGKKVWDTSFKFCFVRNPYTRIYSAFEYLKKGGYGKNDLLYKQLLEPFVNYEAFIMEGGLEFSNRKNIVHFLPQKKYVGEKEKKQLNFLGRFENIDKDIIKVYDFLEMEKKELPVINRTFSNDSKIDIKDIYKNDMKERFFRFYEEDFKLFGYSK